MKSKQQALRNQDGTFLPGSNPHRALGTPNKITRDIKEGIIFGAEAHGRDGKGEGGLPGYCQYLATEHPKVFARLLARLLPLQIKATAAVEATRSEFIGSVNIVPIPHGSFLTEEQAKETWAARVPELQTLVNAPVVVDEPSPPSPEDLAASGVAVFPGAPKQDET